MAKSAGRSSSMWRWLRWVLLALAIGAGFVACVFMAAVHPHKNVMRFEPNYPQRNPSPSRVVSIGGTIPQKFEIKFLAYYVASRIEGHESCYRNMPLGPTFPLHLVEPLDEVRVASDYKISVIVDKYQPGECGWTLDGVGYQLLDKDPVLNREEGFETGGERIVYFSRPADLAAAGDSPKSWHGRVDLWCYKGPVGHHQVIPETCGVLDGWTSSPSFRTSAPADQSGENASTWILQGSTTAEVNFRLLSTVMTTPVEQD
jgi:hypothetical protein